MGGAVMETWKDIPGYEGIYQASDFGNIRSAPNKTTANSRYAARIWKSRILRPKSRKSGGRGDFRVSLWKDGNRKDHLVARLVAMTWCDGYGPNMTVNHIDGDYRNNAASNLEWLTLADNIRHGISTGLYAKSQKAIKLISENGSEEPFPSMAAASRFIGRNPQYVSNALAHGDRIIGASGSVYTVLRRCEDAE